MQPTHFAGPAANPTPARLPRRPIVIPQRVAERAATRYVEDESGCFISTYSTASHGYAQIGWNDGNGHRFVTLCHRAVWVYVHGTQILDGMTIDHLCHNRQCVNPDHLRLLSNFENARRTSDRDWPIGQCINGHSNKHLVMVEVRWCCSACMKEDPKKFDRFLRLDAKDPKKMRRRLLDAAELAARLNAHRSATIAKENTK